MKEVKRAGIAVAGLVLLLLAVGCSHNPPPTPPPPPPPPVQEPAPAPTQVEPAPTPTPAGPVEAPPPKPLKDLEQDARTAGLLGDVFFEFDSYGLDEPARKRLQENAAFFRSSQGQDLLFTIEGHCDERGTNEYNLALGQRRSSAAIDYLVSLGVGRSRFKTISFGEERPFCTESSEACWQRNRRARFVITGRQ